MALSGRAKKILVGAGVMTAGLFAAAGTALAGTSSDPGARTELRIVEDGAPGASYDGDCPYKDGSTPAPAPSTGGPAGV